MFVSNCLPAYAAAAMFFAKSFLLHAIGVIQKFILSLVREFLFNFNS
jgi:hypothetical protein